MSIVVNVPWAKPVKKFMAQFPDWYAYEKTRHDLILNWNNNRPLYECLAEAVMLAQERQSSHILFVEDDQWGFPAGGIEELLSHNKDAIGFCTYRKRWPYRNLCMNKIDKKLTLIGRHRNLKAHEQNDGPEVQKTDVITWAFTLVKTSVFDELYENDKFPFNQQGPVPNDSFFNQYCEDLGIARYVHFGHVIGHGEICTPEDREIMRKIGNQLQFSKRKTVAASEPADIYIDEPYLAEDEDDQIDIMIERFYANNPQIKETV